MKILICSDAGEVLDSTEISREDWDNLPYVPQYAFVTELMVGDAK